MQKYEFHDLCQLFPSIDGISLSALSDDIRQNGLQEPVVLYEGKILDGRNRWYACIDAGVEPQFEEYTGNDPLAYVVSKNMHRRHLTPAQRAMLAHRIMKLSRERAELTGEKPLTSHQAAENLQVGESTVRLAGAIANQVSDKVQDAIIAGQTNLTQVQGVIDKVREKTNTPQQAPVSDEVKQMIDEQVLNAGDSTFNDDVKDGVYNGKAFSRLSGVIQADINRLNGLIRAVSAYSNLVISTEEQKQVVLASCGQMTNLIKDFKAEIKKSPFLDVIQECSELRKTFDDIYNTFVQSVHTEGTSAALIISRLLNTGTNLEAAVNACIDSLNAVEVQ